MSDFLDKIVDTHLDRLPSKFKWYLLIGGILFIVFVSNNTDHDFTRNAIDLTEYHHVNYNPTGFGVAENVGGGSSGNNVSGVILQ